MYIFVWGTLMQYSKMPKLRGQILGLGALTLMIISYQNCARLPQFSSADVASLASEVTSADKAAFALLTAKCGGCHAPGNPSAAGLENLQNLSYLTSRGYINPQDPDGSKLYQRINTNMPPGTPLPAAEKQQIYDWIAGMSGGTTGGAGGAGPGTTIPGVTTTTVPVLPLGPTFASLNQNVFRVYCTGCHGPAPAAAGGGYAMDSYANIRGQVTAGNANSSDLFLRMTNAGAPMPPGGLLPTAMSNAVRDWINAGAANN